MKLMSIRPAQLSLIILVVIGAMFLASTSFYTSVLWYRQLGFENVLFTQIWTQSTLVITAGLVGLLVFSDFFFNFFSRPTCIAS